MAQTLHVVIPVYNEKGTFGALVDRVRAVALPVPWRMRLIIIDDCSNAAGYESVKAAVERLLASGAAVTHARHEVNKGKGAALQTGFDIVLASQASGGGEGGGASDDDLVIIQDADLEYDPNDYPALMGPLIDGAADAVLGTRWGAHRALTGLYRKLHALGNGTLTLLSNLMTGYRVSDMECCYKVVSVAMLRKLRPMLTEPRFGIEPQYVAALSRLKARVVEVPVQYHPRSEAEGKKIGWKDGVAALWVITRERFKSPPPLRGASCNAARVLQDEPRP